MIIREYFFLVNEEMYSLFSEKNPYTVRVAWQKQAVLGASVCSK